MDGGNVKQGKSTASKNRPNASGASTAILDFSFKSLLTTKDMIEEVESGEVSGVKRDTDSGKVICTGLRLNNNSISDLADLSATLDSLFNDPESIEWLDLSFNDLTSITEVFERLRNLKVIYLHGNTIEKIQDTNKLASLSNLKSLTLHGNPIESEKGYRQYVISLLPGLKTLDFSAVTKQDRSTAETWKKQYGKSKFQKRKKSTL